LLPLKIHQSRAFRSARFQMPSPITMPQLSDTMTEGTLVKWHKKEGDKISPGQELADIETDKATMPMEAFDSGVLAVILASVGQKVKVGETIGVIAVGNENPADIRAQYSGKKTAAPASAPASAPRQASQPAMAAAAVPASSGSSSSSAPHETTRGEMHEPDHVGHGATRQPPTSVPPVSRRAEGNGHRVFISPLARRIAADKNIDLRSLRGSGPNGRIVRQDIESYLSQPPAAAATAGGAAVIPQRLGGGEKQVIPLSKMRLAIAKSLVASKQNIPHFYETVEVEIEELVAIRARLNEMLEPEKIRLSLADFLAKAVATALIRHQELNATFNGTEVTRFGDVHMGMAVAVPDGLIVPVLRNIHLMGLREIRQRSVDLIDRARAGRLKQDEMTGATFTISNLGGYGIRDFSAIINPPQVAILAVGAAESRPVVRKGQIVPRTMMNLTLSADHRVVDGATAAEFLRTLKSLLEEPGMILVFS
jgi:pyruvate dehydrogenase E2 component (dihydrolipoamide acetyltransferase)